MDIFWNHLVWDYLRAICYALVILTDLHNIKQRKYDSLLYIGDIVLAIGLGIAALNWGVNSPIENSRAIDLFGTPVVFTWAMIHFYEFLKKI